MTSVDSNFNFMCGRPHGAGPTSPVQMRPPEPDPLPHPCGRHKWMAPFSAFQFQEKVSLEATERDEERRRERINKRKWGRRWFQNDEWE